MGSGEPAYRSKHRASAMDPDQSKACMCVSLLKVYYLMYFTEIV